MEEATGSLGWAALAPWEGGEKGALGTGSGDLPGTSCQLRIALESRRHVPVEKEVGWVWGEERKGNAPAAPQRESTCPGSFVWKLLSLLLRGILEEAWGVGGHGSQ